jgi:hypothetical protein
LHAPVPRRRIARTDGHRPHALIRSDAKAGSGALHAAGGKTRRPREKVAPVTENKRKFLPKKSAGRSQTPLYVAIGGLGVAIYSFAIQAETIRAVVMAGGIVLSVIGVGYWLLNPKHGLD